MSADKPESVDRPDNALMVLFLDANVWNVANLRDFCSLVANAGWGWNLVSFADGQLHVSTKRSK